MKKSAVKKTLLNDLARGVGRAAGTLVKATQGLAANPVAIVQIDKARTKPPKTARRRFTPKTNNRVTKTSTRRLQKRRTEQ
jgi:hypothetical protein